MRIDAFLNRNELNKLYDVTYYHMPERWDSIDMKGLQIDDHIWSDEIKFLDESGLDISNEIKALPNDVGGIYVFFIKGRFLKLFENYLAYIGRAYYTDSQNLRLRCRSYYYEFFAKDRRPKIARLFEKWGEYLYLRFYPLKDNEIIREFEKNLINGILPPFNDEIPDIQFKEPEDAF